MDLLAQFRQSIKHPFLIKNFYVIFVMIFLVLVVGLALILSLSFLFDQPNNLTACDQAHQKNFTDSVRKNSDTIYKINFTGNNSCFLTTWLTWSDKKDLSLWVYDPKGNITNVDNNSGSSYLFFQLPSPLEKGEWRFVVKTDNSNRINYRGEIGFH